MSITEKIKKTTRTVIDFLANKGKASVRKIAVNTGLSKSAVHRHLQMMTKRQKHPESILWESQEGFEDKVFLQKTLSSKLGYVV